MSDVFYPRNRINERKRKIGKYFYDLISGRLPRALCNTELNTLYGLYHKNNIKELKKYVELDGNRKNFTVNEHTKQSSLKLIKFLRKNIDLQNAEVFDYIIYYFYKTLKKGAK